MWLFEKEKKITVIDAVEGQLYVLEIVIGRWTIDRAVWPLTSTVDEKSRKYVRRRISGNVVWPERGGGGGGGGGETEAS